MSKWAMDRASADKNGYAVFSVKTQQDLYYKLSEARWSKRRYQAASK